MRAAEDAWSSSVSRSTCMEVGVCFSLQIEDSGVRQKHRRKDAVDVCEEDREGERKRQRLSEAISEVPEEARGTQPENFAGASAEEGKTGAP